MIRPTAEIPVYLYADFVDMRKSIDGLAATDPVGGNYRLQTDEYVNEEQPIKIKAHGRTAKTSFVLD